MRYDLGSTYLAEVEKTRPIRRDDPRRAKDFLKCEDPKCPQNQDWERFVRRFPDRVRERQFHCHPIF